MAYSFRFLLAAACLLPARAASAQNRVVGDGPLLPEAQVEVALKGDDYLLATLNLTCLTNGGSNSPFAASQLRLAYEHFWNEQWSGGATLRVLGGDHGYGDFIGQNGNITPGLLLRHTSNLGAFTFGQRLGAEYAATFTALGGQSNDRGLARLRFDVARSLPLGKKASLRPRLAYEVAACLRPQRGANDYPERVIDFGALRGEVGLRLSPHLDVTPWVASQTHYITSLPQFNGSGVQVGGGRTNLVVPLVGLDVRLTLGRSVAAAERRQLPTQH